ncbi:MAG TPA: stage III sporulation protein AF [Firmicutes bacterium]|nr:stage III sporulation protein AF [Bacillota bacterium]
MLLALREFVRNVLIIVVLASFLQIILPSGSMRRYAKLALALVMVLTILGPLLKLTKTSWDLNDVLGQAEAQTAWSELKASSELLKRQNDLSLLRTYRNLLGSQLQDLVKRNEEVELVAYQIELVENQQAEDYGSITSINVKCRESQGETRSVDKVEPVQIVKPNQEQEQKQAVMTEWAKEMQGSIKQAIAKYFQLAEEQVSVTFE